MAQIEEQVHHKFKVFVGELNADQTVGEMAGEVASFAEQNKVAAKSIGVEYLESAKRLIITLGYRDDETFYPIQLQSVHLGKIDAPGHDFSVLEQKMAEAGTPGLAFFYGGLVSRKNVLTIMMQSFVSMGWTTVIWFAVGYSLTFSGDVGGVIGNLDMAFLRGINLDTPYPGSDIPLLVHVA
ncbi:MAG: hypothetical protein ABI954_15635, partial [Pyrinomonadaceae bacterium]